jgi:hypothetical protein
MTFLSFAVSLTNVPVAGFLVSFCEDFSLPTPNFLTPINAGKSNFIKRQSVALKCKCLTL